MNLCIIGSGRRFKNFYLDVLLYFSKLNKINIIGLSNKSGILDKNIMIKLNFDKIYSDYNVMIKDKNPDIVILLLPNKISCSVIKKIYNNYKCRILTETCFNLIKIKNFDKENRIGVLENWSYLPIEIIKKELLKLNLIGKINLVENNKKSFYYHASSQLRSYLGFNKTYKINKKTNDKVIAIYNDVKLINRKNINDCSKELIILGEKGYLRGDCFCVEGKRFDPNDFKFNFFYDNKNAKIIVEKSNNFLKSIKVILHDGNIVSWENTFGNFNEEQLSIIYYFNYLLDNNKILYSLDNFLIDLDLMPIK